MAGSILVVEDDENALNGYLEFLVLAGFSPQGVGDGMAGAPVAGLAAALAVPPMAVITDISMPHLNGFQLAEALRGSESTREVPILGLTAHWTVDVTAQATRVGIATLLLKPCMPSHLLAELQRLLGARSGAPAGIRCRP